MTAFQWIVIPVLIAFMVLTGISVARSRLSRRAGAGWILLWLLAAIGVAAPKLLVVVAHVLGIGRGADLVFYASILFGLIGFFLLYLRYRRVTEQLTSIVRHIAIREALDARRESSDQKPPAKLTS